MKTHEIKDLSKKYKIKVWQSYLDQGKLARRIYWAYGPDRKEITILGIEPHPEDKKRGSYKRLKTVLFSSLESRSEKPRSEEHTSELQSRGHLVCRLLLEKKNK